MNILVTGGTGFLGGRLLSVLDEEGYKVSALYRSLCSEERPLKEYKNIEWIRINSKWDNQFLMGFDVILHAATHYGRDEESFLDCVKTNIEFPVRLLDVLGKSGAGYFINIDTFFSKQIYDVGYMLPYVITKRTFAQIGSAVCSKNKNINFINARLEHLYGPGDGDDKFIPFLLNAFSENVDHIKLTECRQKRDFIYIDDAISALIVIINNLKEFCGYNEVGIGTGKSIEIRDLVTLSKKIVGAKTETRFGYLNQRVGEIMDSHADVSKLSQLKWRPIVGLQEGLSLMVSRMAKKPL